MRLPHHAARAALSRQPHRHDRHKTETFKEWELPTPWSNPMTLLDKNENAWTGR